MIPLRVKFVAPGISKPAVLRLRRTTADDINPLHVSDAVLQGECNGWERYYTRFGELKLTVSPHSSGDLDVIFLIPGRGIAHRLIRASSPDNTLVITERCDQICVMCSQPPKNSYFDWFEEYLEAVVLAPQGMTIGLSGGEPTLYKDQLLLFLSQALSARPDLHFHVLTNGQHFEWSDADALSALPSGAVTWGVPLYSSRADLHDHIVGKPGAFVKVLDSLSILAQTGSSIELRTVLLTLNAHDLPALASYIARLLPFVSTWAIMQLENIGYGKRNWRELFVDSSQNFHPIQLALEVATACGLNPKLYNFPLCSIPPPYRENAVRSISDWKQKYLPLCSSCTLRDSCGGFFTWYDHAVGFENLRAQ